MTSADHAAPEAGARGVPPEARALLAALLGRCSFPPPGTAVTCAVSGGADSLALLVLAVAAGCEVVAVHVDHGLRPESSAEAAVVAAAAAKVGARFEARAAVVSPGPNLEERARIARYGALPTDVLTGHTLDDQAETVLLNLVRGAGLHGLSAIRPSDRRPLLDLRRTDTAALCEAVGLVPVVDASNADPAIRRNRIRHELLPLLADIADRDVAPLLARTADVCRASADLLDAEATALDPADARAVTAAPEVLASLALRAWIRSGTGSTHPPVAATIARVRNVAAGGAVATDVGEGWEVRRSGGRLSLRRTHP